MLDEISIEKYYLQGLKIKEIAKFYKTRCSNISKILKDRSVRLRKRARKGYIINDNYFNKIDSPEKSYLLGIMYSDGNVSDSNNRITLVSNDLDLLYFFRKEIGSDKKIYKNHCHKKAFTFAFSSEIVKKDLINLGCIPKKSLILEFPSADIVPENFLSSFILGYFDGDGSIHVTEKIHQFKIISSTKFCVGLASFLKNKFGFQVRIENDKRYKKETSYIRITSFKKIRMIRDFLYKNNHFSLDRKKKKMYLL